MTKKAVLLALVHILFLLVMVPLGATKSAASLTAVYVDPSTVKASVDSTFTVNVSIANVEDLYGYEFTLYYNTTFLDGLKAELPPGHFFTQTYIFIIKLEVTDHYNATHGRIWAAVDVHAGPALSGSGVLVAITFKCTGEGKSVLGFDYTKLIDIRAMPIPHDVYDGYVEVELLGDVNGDGIVDISDMVLAAVAFGSRPGHPNWNPDADLNQDDLIDISDLVIIGVNYGKHG